MPSQVVILLGPARSGKTWEMLRQYRGSLRSTDGEVRVNQTVWLAPTARAAATVREQLLDPDFEACLSPGVMTFDQLTHRILSSSAAAAPSVIPPAMARELLRRVIRAAIDRDQLVHYRAAAGRSGFVDLLADHFRELKRSGVSPAAYAAAAASYDRAAEHRELALLFADYEQILASHGLCDAEGRHDAAIHLLAAGACARWQSLELVVVDGFTDFTRTQHKLLRLLAQRAKRLMIALPSEFTPLDGVREWPSYRNATEPGQQLGLARTNEREATAPDEMAQPSPSSIRADLFAKVTATLAELKHYHPNLEVYQLPPRPLGWPALDHLARHVFRNPRQVPPLAADAIASLPRIDVIAAAGAHDEIVELARHIKRRLAAGEARPGDVVVAFRSLGSTAARIREVFTDCGIPHALETGLPLASAGIMRTLLAVLRLDAEDWSFRRAVSVITNNTLTAIDPAGRRAAEWLVRDLQISTGRDALVRRTEQLAALDPAVGEISEHIERRVAAAKLALPVFQLLATSFDALPDSADPSQWHDAVTRLVEQLGIAPIAGAQSPVSDRPPSSGAGGGDGTHYLAADCAAWQIISEQFRALEHLDQAVCGAPRSMSRNELVSWLVDLTAHESLPRPHDDVGRVRILSAATARTIAAPHLYLAGMSEQSFPSAERAGRLGTDTDYRFFSTAADQDLAEHLATRGAIAPAAPSRAQGEMLLFHELVTRAEKSLTISYPALDDKAQVLPPSPYVIELLRTLGDAASQVKQIGPHLSPIASVADVPCSPSQWRVLAVARGIGPERDPRLLAGLMGSAPRLPLAAALEAGLRITHARQRREEFGPAEGLLTSPAAVARLADRFGPKHMWSPTQWENYAACPYRFQLADVLKLEPLGELTLDTDYRRRGSLLHHVLATFHRKYGAESPDVWNALARDEEKFSSELLDTLQSAVEGTPREGVDAALAELDRRQIAKWIAQYRAQHATYDATWDNFDVSPRPTHFELRFGPRRPGDEGLEDPRSTNDPFPLELGDETVLVTGRIDRIDVGRAGNQAVFNVIDYKSGRRPAFSSEKLTSGERLQPAVYLMAAEVLVFGGDRAQPGWAGYWSMQNGVRTDAKYSLRCSIDGVVSDDWLELRSKIVARIKQFVTSIRRGEFPVASRDPDCTSRCDFHTICRIAQIRSLEKTWEPNAENLE